MKKRNVAIMFGGCSDEYEVSLKSAASVIAHIDRNKYDLILLGITRDGRWLKFSGPEDAVATDMWHRLPDCVPAIFSPSRDFPGLLELSDGSCQITPLDVILPVLHGANGEDGRLQGLLDLSGIPYAGCGTLSSAMAMDKDIAHQLAKDAGIQVPKSLIYRRGDSLPQFIRSSSELEYPLFVKPARGGSSIGMSRIHRAIDLPQALAEALAYDEKVVVEEGISGFEVGCAVIGNQDITVGTVDEVELKDDVFFDYKEKYTQTKTIIHLPARISPAASEAVQEAGRTLYKAFCCQGLARIDFFLTPKGEIVFNEINTFPGFTAGSRYPRMLQHAGLSYSDIIDKLIDSALEAHPAAVPDRQEICLKPDSKEQIAI